MRNYFIYIVASTSLLLLSACTGEGGSSEESVEASSQENVQADINELNDDGPISQEVNFGEPFYAKDKLGSDVFEFEVTVEEYEIVENKHSSEEFNNDYDSVKLKVGVENIGDETIHSSAVSKVSFSFYDENGVEIFSTGTLTIDDETFKFSDIRPGGKNEGIMYISITKGEVPATMIFSPGIGGDDEYIFNLE